MDRETVSADLPAEASPPAAATSNPQAETTSNPQTEATSSPQAETTSSPQGQTPTDNTTIAAVASPRHRPSSTSETPAKIEVLLKAVGDAPIMKQRNWSLDGGKTVLFLMQFVRNYLRISKEDSLFIYVNQCFAPSPDQTIENLFKCFASDGKLVLHYSKTQAWG